MIDQFDDVVLNDALEFATAAHAGQIRKYTDNIPYITHPIGVTEILMEVCDDTEMLAAALLHDTVEDCDVTLDDIRSRFGERVAALVDDLTDKTSKKTHSHLNREQRRHLDHERLAGIVPDAKTIKLADVIHNTSMINIAPKRFADLYMTEKLELLKVLDDGHPVLYAKANQIVIQYFAAQSKPV